MLSDVTIANINSTTTTATDTNDSTAAGGVQEGCADVVGCSDAARRFEPTQRSLQRQVSAGTVTSTGNIIKVVLLVVVVPTTDTTTRRFESAH